MDEETFFKGVEVGRALRGWRTPDTGSTPSGTTNITKNGEYDVSRYASANVNVQFGVRASTGDSLKAIQGSVIELCTMSDTSLRVHIDFRGFKVGANNYPTSAVLRVNVSVMNGGHNGTGDYLGYVMLPDTLKIPNNQHLSTVYNSPSTILQGTKDVDFIEGPTKNGHKLSLTSSQLPLFSLLPIPGLMLTYSSKVLRVACSGDAWNSYNGIWRAYFDVDVTL